jgi:hypothetical protein
MIFSQGQVRHKNAHVKVEFGFGFGPLVSVRVIPLEQKKRIEVFSFRSLSLLQGCTHLIQI